MKKSLFFKRREKNNSNYQLIKGKTLVLLVALIGFFSLFLLSNVFATLGYGYDNNGGTITVQSALAPMGEMSVNNNAKVTAINSAGQWTKINATWVNNSDNMEFSVDSSGILTYTGTDMKFFHIACTISIKGVGNNDVVRAVVFKNGNPLTAGEVQQKLGTAGDVGSTAIHVATTLENGDDLEVYILNEGTTNDFTVTYANIFAMGMPMQ